MHIPIVRKWIFDIVIGCNFCPFALNEYTKDTIHYQVTNASDLQNCLEALMNECQRLDTNEQIETTLLIIPNGFNDFFEFLTLVNYSEKLLKQQGYEGVYQIATFHPLYCFQGSDENDPANYTNRSPYPVLQLLREESIEKVLRHYSDPGSIPERNIAFAREKGVEYMRELLKKVTNKR